MTIDGDNQPSDMTGLAPPWGGDALPPVPAVVIWTAAESGTHSRTDKYGPSGSRGGGDRGKSWTPTPCPPLVTQYDLSDNESSMG